MVLGPLKRIVRNADKKRPRGRINLSAKWIGEEVIVAPSNDYIVLHKNEYNELLRFKNNLLITKEVFERILNIKANGKKMFSIVTRTWNPVTGCTHLCIYCWARRLAETKLKNHSRYKGGFIPRIHQKEFKTRFKEGEFVFVSDMGDLFCGGVDDEWILQVLNHIRKFPKTYFLFMTKNPERYEKFLDVMPSNAILGATIETNDDELYRTYKISHAPIPSLRYKAMKNLKWDKKFISIEPILDFDLYTFKNWIRDILPFMVYIGYDNYNNKLPEPSLTKTMKLIEELSRFTLVVKKTIRPAWDEQLETVTV